MSTLFKCLCATTAFLPLATIAQVPTLGPPTYTLSVTQGTTLSSTKPGIVYLGTLTDDVIARAAGSASDNVYFGATPQSWPALDVGFNTLNDTRTTTASASTSYQFAVHSNDPTFTFNGLVVPVDVKLSFLAVAGEIVPGTGSAFRSSNDPLNNVFLSLSVGGVFTNDLGFPTIWTAAWCTSDVVPICNGPNVASLALVGNFASFIPPYFTDTEWFQFDVPWFNLNDITIAAGAFSAGNGGGHAFIDPAIGIDPSFALANQLHVDVSPGIQNVSLGTVPSGLTPVVFQPTLSVPEPRTLSLLLIGLAAAGLGSLRRVRPRTHLR